VGVKKGVRPCTCLCIDSIFTWILTRPFGLTATGQNMQNIQPGRIFLQMLSLGDLFSLQNEIYRIYADCLDECPAKINLPTREILNKHCLKRNISHSTAML
jgi:hypothetical protein